MSARVERYSKPKIAQTFPGKTKGLDKTGYDLPAGCLRKSPYRTLGGTESGIEAGLCREDIVHHSQTYLRIVTFSIERRWNVAFRELQLSLPESMFAALSRVFCPCPSGVPIDLAYPSMIGLLPILLNWLGIMIRKQVQSHSLGGWDW